MPWKTFNLDRNASESDLKRAYAKLLKQHRPDKDPEGFARINQAYQEAKQELALRQELAPAPPPGEELPSPGLPPLNQGFFIEDEPPLSSAADAVSQIDLPEEFLAGRSDVREALAGRDPGRIDEALQSFNRVCIDRVDLIPEWGMAIAEDFWDRQLLLARLMPRDDLLREMEYGHNRAALAVLEGWGQRFDVEAMRGLAQAILEAPGRYHNEAAAVVCARLGAMLALVDPRRAGELADRAFESLPTEQRFLYVDELNHAIAAADCFRLLRSDQKVFWAQRLSSPGREYDWDDEESSEALRYLRTEMPYHWDGLTIVKRVIPPDKWGKLGAGVGSLEQQSAAPVSTGADSGDTFSGWGCLAFLPIYLLIKMVAFGTCDSSREPAPLPDFRPGEFRREDAGGDAKRLEKILEEHRRRWSTEDQGPMFPAPGGAGADEFPEIPRVSDLPELEPGLPERAPRDRSGARPGVPPGFPNVPDLK